MSVSTLGVQGDECCDRRPASQGGVEHELDHQEVLFGKPPPRSVWLAWSVSVPGPRDASNLPLVVASARAAALQGCRSMILCTDGSTARVSCQGDRFPVTADGPATCPEVVCRLLDVRS